VSEYEESAALQLHPLYTLSSFSTFSFILFY
jgi:hypothetical protein